MTPIRLDKQWMPVIILLLLLVISLACNVNTDTSSTPEASLPEELVIERDTVFGPGSFIYTETNAGLKNLSSYKATLLLGFDGTRDGQPETWSRTYIMLATNNPAARQWTIETTGQVSLFLAEMDGMDYEKRGEDACLANAIPPEDTLTEELELAYFLTGVIGAEEAGTETVNDLAANHYIFDQRAMGQDGLTESTGEIWVAAEDGYIVKYLLTTKANADYFGDGMEGTLTWDYQLSDVNLPAAITLPDGCPPGLVDAPMLPDASNVLNMGGMLAYDTSNIVEDVTAFYQEKMPELGWTPQGEPATTEVNAFLTYTMGDQSMTVIVTAGETSTEVRILVSKTQVLTPP